MTPGQAPSRHVPAARRMPFVGRGRTHRPLAWLAALWLATFAAPAVAQTVRLEIGIAGETVAGAWNPLRLTLTDVPPAQLELRFDEGSLREGPRIVRYQANVPGGSGVTVFEDDVFVPRYRTMSWHLANAQRVYASGSKGIRDADPRPLDLLLSADPGRWRSAFAADARPVDVTGPQLVDRAAAYDGVRTLAIDGTTAAPRLEAVAAAAAGGVRIVLVGALPASQSDLALLTNPGEAAGPDGLEGARLGAGTVVRSADTVADLAKAIAASPTIDRASLTAAIASDPMLTAPPPVSQALLLSLAGGFALLVLVLVRFAGTPGLVATAVLVAIVAVAAWQYLRPAAPVLTATRTAWLGGGDLALRLGVEEVLTLPAGTVALPDPARTQPPLPYLVDGTGTHVTLGRWSMAGLVLRPRLAAASLRFDGSSLRNVGQRPLTDVYVVGLGPQGVLAAGSSMVPARAEEGAASPLYTRLAALLPEGSALARSGDEFWLALPSTLAFVGGER